MKKLSTFFITGVNGAGKSTLVPLLKKELTKRYCVYDFDERGVPENVDKQWRQKTTRHWMRVAHRNSNQQIVTVICGLAIPSEIQVIAKKEKIDSIKIALLEIGAPQIAKRLRQRFSTAARIRNLKRVTGLTVNECITANIQHAKRIRKQCKKRRCQVFNTARSNPETTAIRVSKWIKDNVYVPQIAKENTGHTFLGQRLFVLTAHPDDESYAAAGTIFRNHQLGGVTALVCATDGEKGTSHLKRQVTMLQLRRIRKKELLAAAKVLGTQRVHFLSLPDGQVDRHASLLYRRGLALARRFRPEAILSFGPDGISGHLDHIAAGQAAERIAARLRLPLFTFALPPSTSRLAQAFLRLRRRARHYARKVQYQRPTMTVAVNPRIKQRALRCHASQMDGRNAFTGFPKFVVKQVLRTEYFRQIS